MILSTRQPSVLQQDPVTAGMHKPCDLEVQVNEDHIFILRQKPLITFSGRMLKIFKTAATPLDSQRLPRVLLHDFPGGVEAFELAARFCYSGGRIAISNSNVSVLRCVAHFLEMTEEYTQGNLVRMTETYLQNLTSWDLDGILTVLKGCESVLLLAEKTQIVQRCADALAWKICSSLEDMSPLSSSPDSIAYRMHSGSMSRRSSASIKGSHRTWWFADVSSLPVYLMEKVLKTLIYNDVDNKILARFLIHYLRSSLPVLGYSWVSAKMKSADEEIQRYSKKTHLTVLEIVVNLLFHLERGSTSCRFLFSLFRVATVLNASKTCKRQLEKMIGSQLHVANLDSILVPLHPPRSGSLYDVDLVFRLVMYFFKEQEARGTQEERVSSMDTPVGTPSTRVGDLIDSYLAEIAPDTSLKLQKFLRLAQALPASTRWSHDGLYRAVDIYLEAHPNLTDLEVTALCKVIDIQKLSFEACRHISKNPRLPAKFTLQVLVFQQAKLRDSVSGCYLKDKNSTSSLSQLLVKDDFKSNPPKLSDLPDFGYRSTQLRSDLSQINSKVAELEKACRSIRSEVAKHNRVARRLMC